MIPTLQLYDTAHNKLCGLTNYSDLYVEQALGTSTTPIVLDQLHFKYALEDSRRSQIDYECYVATEDAEYIVKEINLQTAEGGTSGPTWVEYVCDLNVEPLKGTLLDSFAPGSALAEDAANLALAGTGWTVGCSDITKRRTAAGTNCTVFEALEDIVKAYSCEITFDTVHKLVNIHQALGTDRGAYFAEQLNLKTLQVQGNSRDYVTRLYPIGKDGMTIASVNGGVAYVSNYQYSTKVISAYWIDNRYTVPADMLADAQDRLDYMSSPTTAYAADIIDLANASGGKYKLLDYGIGDTITLLAYSVGVQAKQRLVKTDRYYDEDGNIIPDKCTCEISNKIASLDDIVLRVSDAADAIDAATDSTGTIMGNSVQVTNSDGTYSTLTVALETAGELIATKATITDLQAATARITTLEATSVTTTYLTTNYLTADAVRATYATIDNVQATYATIDNLNTQKGRIDALESTTVTTTYLTAHYTTTTDLQAVYATIANLNVANGKISDLQSDNGTIINLLSNNAGIGSLTTDTATANYAALLHGTLGDAQIGSLSVAKLLAGVINTTKFTLQSDSGRLSLTDNTMQVSDANRVRVQLGKDGNGDYNIYVWDASGNLMFDAAGLHSSGIKSGIIRDSMVANDAAINATKIDKESMVSQINGATTLLNSSRVKYDSTGQTLTVAFDALKTTVSSQGSTLTSQGTAISTMQGQITSKIWTTDITSAMNGMAGSGRNVVLNSTFDSSKSNWSDFSNGGTNTIVTGYSGHNAIEISRAGASSGNRQGISQTCSIAIHAGETYTISAWVYVKTGFDADNNQIFLRTADFGNVPCIAIPASTETGKWIHFTNSHTFSQDTGAYLIYVLVGVNGTVDVSQIKIEQGTVATGWSPAPEDTATAISANSSAITQLNNQIALKVDTSTYNSDVGSLQTRMSSAEEKITSDAIVSTVTASSSWSSLSNTASTASTTASSAASAAATAQTTANSKAKTFTSQPTPPYSLGDLWTSTTQETRVCTTARASGSYTASDWTAASSVTESRISTAESKITATAITNAVKANLNGTDVASIINQTATDVTISSPHVKITATSIDIDGLINAININTNTLYAQRLTTSAASIYGTIGSFTDYGSSGTYTAQGIGLYDSSGIECGSIAVKNVSTDANGKNTYDITLSSQKFKSYASSSTLSYSSLRMYGGLYELNAQYVDSDTGTIIPFYLLMGAQYGGMYSLNAAGWENFIGKVNSTDTVSKYRIYYGGDGDTNRKLEILSDGTVNTFGTLNIRNSSGAIVAYIDADGIVNGTTGFHNTTKGVWAIDQSSTTNEWVNNIGFSAGLNQMYMDTYYGRAYFNAVGASDERLKSGIAPSTVDALGKVRSIQRIQYTLISTGKYYADGVSAQQLTTVDTEYVCRCLTDAAGIDYYGPCWDRIMPDLIGAVQQTAIRDDCQDNEIALLNAQIAALQARVAALEAA